MSVDYFNVLKHVMWWQTVWQKDWLLKPVQVATCLYSEQECVPDTERLHHFQGQQEGLATPNNQLLSCNFNGAMSSVVSHAVKIHLVNSCNKKHNMSTNVIILESHKSNYQYDMKSLC